MNKVNTILTTLTLFIVISGYTQKSQLQLKEIMKGEEFVGYQPENIFWHPNSKKVYFRWKPSGKDLPKDWYHYYLSPSKTVKTEIEEIKLFHRNGIWSKKRDFMIYVRNGNIWRYDKKMDESISLTNTMGNKQLIGFSNGESGVFFIENSNVYLLGINKPQIEQLTNFQKTKDEKDKKVPASEEWLAQEEIQLFDIRVHSKKVSKYLYMLKLLYTLALQN